MEELTRIEELKRQQLEITIQELREKVSEQVVKMDDMANKHTLECDHIRLHFKETIEELRKKLDKNPPPKEPPKEPENKESK